MTALHVVGEQAGLVVIVDAAPPVRVGRGVTIEVDPGWYHVEVSGPGLQPYTTDVRVEAGSTVDVVAPRLEPKPGVYVAPETVGIVALAVVGAAALAALVALAEYAASMP